MMVRTVLISIPGRCHGIGAGRAWARRAVVALLITVSTVAIIARACAAGSGAVDLDAPSSQTGRTDATPQPRQAPMLDRPSAQNAEASVNLDAPDPTGTGGQSTTGAPNGRGAPQALAPSVPSLPRRQAAIVAGSRDREAQAASFVSEYFARWSDDAAAALAYVSNAYASTVDFYGKPISRQALLVQKRAYIMRWPVRSYIVRPASITVSCDEVRGECLASGLVDWDCRSVQRRAHSTGTANFALKLYFGGCEADYRLRGGFGCGTKHCTLEHDRFNLNLDSPA